MMLALALTACEQKERCEQVNDYEQVFLHLSQWCVGFYKAAFM